MSGNMPSVKGILLAKLQLNTSVQMLL